VRIVKGKKAKKRKKKKKEGKKRKKEGKEEKKEGKGEKEGGPWPAVVGGGCSWPEIDSPSNMWGCKCSSNGKIRVLKMVFRRTKL